MECKKVGKIAAQFLKPPEKLHQMNLKPDAIENIR